MKYSEEVKYIERLSKKLRPLSTRMYERALKSGDYNKPCHKGDNRRYWYSIFSVVGCMKEYVVTRNYMIRHTNYKRKENYAEIIGEATQQWVNMETGKRIIRSVPMLMFWGWMCQPFALGSTMRTIKQTGWNSERLSTGDIYLTRVHKKLYFSRAQLIDIDKHFCLHWALSQCAMSPFFEQLYKQKRYKFLAALHDHGYYVKNADIMKLKAAYNIAIRHGFDVEQNASSWLDHIHALAVLGLDYHSPHYVAPENFQEQHQELTSRANALLRRKREQEELKRKLREAENKEETYSKIKGKYLGIAYENKTYKVHVLQSVREHVEEGEAMHHCVGSMGYWEKQNSIILSVCDHSDNRVTTVEMSLKDGHVIQNYAACDKVHPDDANIRKLITSNFYRFKEVKRKKAA